MFQSNYNLFMSELKKRVQRVGSTKIKPISKKILVVFVFLLLFSNFSTNLISTMLSQRQITSLSNTILAEHLKQVFMSANNQYELFKYSGDKDSAVNAIKQVSKSGLPYKNSISCAFDADGKFLFIVNGDDGSGNQELLKWDIFPDEKALKYLNNKLMIGTNEGVVPFSSEIGEYIGVYKYQSDWNLYMMCAERHHDTIKSTYMNFAIISCVILFITFLFLWVGLILLNKILKNIRQFAYEVSLMQETKKLGTIDISKAPNDDVTYFAASFNSLSSSVNNLISTFQRFAPKDISDKAYAGKPVGLEGTQRELTLLFSDIKNFTYRTETLGSEIIDLLNIHYNRIIHIIHENSGVIGSIIGDAVLGIYGTEDESLKSLCSVKSAWQMTRVTSDFRQTLQIRKQEIEKKRKLSSEEESVFSACLIDIGVGIDGGTVFYGNIGSKEHMANTVIGDNVNSASRLEGLTRVYGLPVIVSKYIKEEVEKVSAQYHFYEIDMVQVKGKTEGKKIYFPLDCAQEQAETDQAFSHYEQALQAYYEGDWIAARKKFKLFIKAVEEVQPFYASAAEVFLKRMGLKSAPENWSGIWAMTTK